MNMEDGEGLNEKEVGIKWFAEREESSKKDVFRGTSEKLLRNNFLQHNR